jgi:hypothetical protein
LTDASKEIRRTIELLAPRKDARFVPNSSEMPCVWRPNEVDHPETPGIPFTEPGAWRFIAELAKSGHPIREVVLHKPKGDKGYEIEYEQPGGTPIYIKVQIKKGKIIGRSFHYSTK